MISLQSFAVLVHEAICFGSDECMYINTSSNEAENEYEYFRNIVQDLRLLTYVSNHDPKYPNRKYRPTLEGYEFLATHNLYLPEENNE